MRKIYLSDSIATLRIETRNALCVRHKAYDFPMVDCEWMEWEEFEHDPRAAMRGKEQLVIVGLNRIMTPSNRTKEVFEVLFNLSPEWEKISVDRTLFIGEPWRAWFHFGLVGAAYREYTYSFLAESHWKAFQEGGFPEDPFSIEEIVKAGSEIITSDYKSFFEPFDIKTIQQPASVKAEYEIEKELSFEEEHTLNAILDRLSRFALAGCPERKIPRRSDLFRYRKHSIVITDLKIDAFLLERLARIAELTNKTLEVFNGNG